MQSRSLEMVDCGIGFFTSNGVGDRFLEEGWERMATLQGRYREKRNGLTESKNSVRLFFYVDACEVTRWLIDMKFFHGSRDISSMILACFWSFWQVTYWNFFPSLTLQCPLCFETFVEGVYQN